MDFIVGDHKSDIGQIAGQYLIDEVGYRNFHSEYTFILWHRDNQIKAVSLFDYYRNPSIEWHFCGKNALTRSTIACIHNYVFDQLKCNTMVVRPARMSSMNKVIPRLGFKFLGIIPRFYGDIKDHDAILYYTNKEMFGSRYLKSKEE